MHAEASSPPRGRRILIALLILLLILLPLYLWPLRGGLGGLPGATALPGSRPDPRSPAALAQIPSDVWDALMGGPDGSAPAAPAPRSRNLTMIAQPDQLAGVWLGTSVGESPLSESPAARARAMIAQLSGPADPSRGEAEGDGLTPGPLLASGPGDGPGAGSPWNEFAFGGYPVTGGNWGPWNGGGSGGVPGSTFVPGDPGALEATPEPATLLLVGSNLALLGAAQWRRRRQRREAPSIG